MYLKLIFLYFEIKNATIAMTKVHTGWFKNPVPPQIFPMGPLGLLKVYGHMVFSKKLEMVTLEYRQLLI